jgi:sigma-B regulation protein RsbU (phosphoserine phosphatase)
VGILFSIIVGNLAAWWLTKPMKVLLGGMEEIQSGNLDYKISIGTRDEFGKLGAAFNTMSVRLKKYIKDLTEATRDKERLNRELEIAAEMQRAMLPHYELKVEDVDLAGLSLPAKQVGGDYFDYMSGGDGNNIGFVIADAAGKGLPSSIFMTNSKSIFKVLTTEERSPAKVIRRTNDLVISNVDPSSAMFATMFYGIYDRNNKVFRYSNAGHNPPIFVDKAKGSVNLLNAHGCPIGVMEDQPYGEDEIAMKSGDAVVLYTDGVIEAVDDKREMFGMKRLIDICMETMDLSAQEVVNRIRDSVFEFAGKEPQFDDLTLLVFRIR